MTAINFKACFADAVKAGTKCQTIRTRGKRPPPKPGDVLQLYGVIGSAKLRDVVVTAVTPICISTNTGSVQIANAAASTWQVLDRDQLDELVRADGFASSREFFDFFEKSYGRTFSGHLIQWGAPR